MKAFLTGQFISPVIKEGQKNNWLEFGVLNMASRSLETFRIFQFKNEKVSDLFLKAKTIKHLDFVLVELSLYSSEKGLNAFVDEITEIEENVCDMIDSIKTTVGA